MAVMSAKNPHHKTKDGIYHFEMNQAIPCYLIALAVGDLSYRKLGVNSGVYAEPQLLAKASYEFADLPNMITTAENLYGPYKWEQYDLLVLPYSFPYGGMENPRLTFVNPTLLVGDRSLVSVVAHELAHSWSGNLVTNSSWDDFWLNEGFTVYFENRIMEQLYSKEIADMLALIEFQELEKTIKSVDKSEHPEDSRLKLNLANRDPEEGLSDIAYVKGAFFLKSLENKVGRKRFDHFLKNYFQHFAFKTINTEQFENYLNAQLLVPNKLTFNSKDWLYNNGLPTNCLKIHSPRFDTITQLAMRFSKGENIFKKKITWLKIKGKRRKKKIVYQLKREDFIVQEWQVFVRSLPEKMPVEQLKLVDKNMNFKNWGNAEIMTEWFVLGIHSDYKAVFPSIQKFLTKIGRRKFLLPIYSALAAQDNTKKWALGVYKKAKANYHPITQRSIEELIY
jgi:aminopeptidase N